MSWLFLTILSALSISVSRIIQKSILNQEEADSIAFSCILQVIVGLIFLGYTVLTGTLEFPNLAGLLPHFILMAVFYSVANMLLFISFKLAEASEIIIILASSTVWSVLAAIVLLGESLTTKSILGICLVVLGVVVINFQKTKWQFNRGHALALMASLLLGIAFTNDAYLTNRYHSIPSYLILAFAVPGFLSLLYKPKATGNMGYFLGKPVVLKLVAASVTYALAAITIFAAFKSGGPASIISPISQTNIIFTVVMSFMLLKERDHLPKKLIGMLLAFGGVLFLV